LPFVTAVLKGMVYKPCGFTLLCLLPFVKKGRTPLCPILVFTAESDIVRPKFEEVAHWWMLNRVVHSTEIAGKLTLERGISYITSKY
jgi:hypothetical protein